MIIISTHQQASTTCRFLSFRQKLQLCFVPYKSSLKKNGSLLWRSYVPPCFESYDADTCFGLFFLVFSLESLMPHSPPPVRSFRGLNTMLYQYQAQRRAISCTRYDVKDISAIRRSCMTIDCFGFCCEFQHFFLVTIPYMRAEFSDLHTTSFVLALLDAITDNRLFLWKFVTTMFIATYAIRTGAYVYQVPGFVKYHAQT